MSDDFTRPRGAARIARVRAGPFNVVQRFDQPALGERFAGALLGSGRDGAASRAAAASRRSPAPPVSPMSTLAYSMLASGGGFHGALEQAYDARLTVHPRNLLTLQTMAVSGAFLLDADYRAAALAALCAARFETDGFLLAHPPSVGWQARDQQAALRMHRLRDRDLAMCTLLGEIGFAQLCDDRLGLPVPLLVRPWSRDRGLLRPRRLPPRTFSQTLCVDHVGARQLLLFDRRAVQPPWSAPVSGTLFNTYMGDCSGPPRSPD